MPYTIITIPVADGLDQAALTELLGEVLHLVAANQAIPCSAHEAPTIRCSSIHPDQVPTMLAKAYADGEAAGGSVDWHDLDQARDCAVWYLGPDAPALF